MKFLLAATTSLIAFSAHGEGVLNIYNWGDYTSPELIEKFSAEYDIKVTVSDYDSNETAIAKIRAGGHGFDIVVPSASFVPLWISEGLLLQLDPTELPNHANISERWLNVDWDPGRLYSVPWLWGLTGIVGNTSVYDGNLNTADIIFKTPEALKGSINVAPELNDVLYLAIKYKGGEWCTGDLEFLKGVRDLLVEAKKDWISMDYGLIEKMAAGDFNGAYYWNGAAMRARLQNADIGFGFPETGYPLFMDSAAILADSENIENAKLFINYIMAPENAALISEFAKYANGIDGSEEFMSAELRDAPEINVPEEFLAAGDFYSLCAPEINEIYTKIWTEISK